MTQHTFVLVHGAFQGGWCWRLVSELLRNAGHEVFSPTLTGLGERAHLLTPAVGIETFIQDITAVLEYEELTNVVLVAHSYGGVPVTGAVDRVPHRIRQVVYLDALLVDDGQCAFDQFPDSVVETRLEDTEEVRDALCMRNFPAHSFGVTTEEDLAWVSRRITPMPVRAYQETVSLDHAIGNGLPCTYIAATNPHYPPLEQSRILAQNRAGWSWLELHTGHSAMISDPSGVAHLLCKLASASTR